MSRFRQTRRTARVAPVVSIALLAVVAAGCGSSGPGVCAGAGTPREAAAAAARAVGGEQVVRFHGVEFTVPASWPVYDLAADPTTCVRFDVHAVYLGRPGPDMRCPANLFGRADAVLVEPLDGSDVGVTAVDAGSVNGLALATDPGAGAEQQVRAALPGAGVAVTIAYADASRADEILGSFRGVTP
jgi:hypothetical protein